MLELSFTPKTKTTTCCLWKWLSSGPASVTSWPALKTEEKVIDYLAGQGKYADRQKYPLPSLLLLDLKLPIKSGFEILEWIRNESALKGLKVVIVSSSGHQVDIDLALKMGAIDYIVKPSVPARLTEVLRSRAEEWFK